MIGHLQTQGRIKWINSIFIIKIYIYMEIHCVILKQRTADFQSVSNHGQRHLLSDYLWQFPMRFQFQGTGVTSSSVLAELKNIFNIRAKKKKKTDG